MLCVKKQVAALIYHPHLSVHQFALFCAGAELDKPEISYTHRITNILFTVLSFCPAIHTYKEITTIIAI
jgi:hypothetical protein